MCLQETRLQGVWIYKKESNLAGGGDMCVIVYYVIYCVYVCVSALW